MSESKALSTVPEADYEAIEGAVMETARGRWFLSEYARRNRTADTETLLTAIGRIESLVQEDRETQEMDRLRFDLMEMAKAIARTKSEIASIRPQGAETSELNVASEALDAIVRTTERATSDILEAAEHVQEAAWTLREQGADEPMCDELDRRATDIYTACSFQDLTAQRTSRIVNTLRYLESRINAMIEIWGAAEPEEDERKQADLSESLDVFNGLSQADVDTFIVARAQAAAQETTAAGDEAPAADAYFFDIDVPTDPHLIDTALAIPTARTRIEPEVEEVTWADVEADDDGSTSATAATGDGAVSQDDELFAEEAHDEPQSEDATVDDQSAALAELDALDVTEKLRRFT
jgi:chemotaxis regulatin CheY-phosphate phosphatase CheZ